MLRIAAIDNLSARAYTLVRPQFEASFTGGTPTEVHRQLQSGQCDAALLSVARLAEHAPHYEPLGSFGIACRGKVQSVVLFAQDGVERLLDQALPIHVTQASQTSLQLLYVLCRQTYRRAPVFAAHAPHARARLLIGDEAISTSRPEYAWPLHYDLCAWWFEQTQLPFVFARWVVRRDLAAERKAALLEWLEATVAVAESESGQHRMTRRLMRQGLGKAQAAQYYQQVRGRLTLEDLLGLELFLRRQREESACRHIA